MYQFTKRLTEGVDLKQSILELAKEKSLPAAVVVCSVGSLKFARLRLPGAKHDQFEEKEIKGPLEIIHVNGRISENGVHAHLHLSVSDKGGNVYGGHLLDGCKVRTTLELVLLVFDDVRFKSVSDSKTGFLELEVEDI